MDTVTLKAKLLRGSRLGLVRVMLAIPLYLVLTPLALNQLGTPLFAIWSFQTMVAALFNLSNFGFTNGLVFHLARRLDEKDEINRYFNVAFFAFLLLGCVISTLILIGSGVFSTEVLKVPDYLHEEAIFVLNITAISLCFSLMASPYRAILEAHQEHGYVQAISLAWLLFYFLGSMVALWVQPGVYSLGAVLLLSHGLYWLAFYWRARRHAPFLRVHPRYLSRDHVRSMLRYGVGLQGAAVAIALREPLLKILVARHFDLATVAAFEIVYRICTQLISFVVTPLLGLFSASALLSAQPQELQKILRPCLGYTVALLFPMAVFLVSSGGELAQWWLGDKAGQVVALLPLAFAAFAFYYLTEVLYKAIEASGWSYYSAAIQICSLGVTVAAFFTFGDDPYTTILAALWAGFSLLSISNLVAFRYRFPGMRLIGWQPPLVALLLAGLYLTLDTLLDSAWRVIGYLIYLLLHLWTMQRFGIFNLIKLARRVMVERFI